MSKPSETRWGIGIPQFFVGQPLGMQLVKSYVVRAESLGFESLWVADLPPRDFPWLDPVSLLTWTAATTSRVGLGTAVLIPTVHNPVQLAKSLATLDHMSGGRLILGVGTGGIGMDYARYGLTQERLVRRFLECIEVMKALWTEPSVTYRGVFINISDLSVAPKPVQKPWPPLWFGGSHPNALKRAVRHADGWIGAGGSSSSSFKEALAQILESLAEVKRERSTFTISRRVYIAIDSDSAKAKRRLEEWFSKVYFSPAAVAHAVYGSPTECAEKLADIAAAGPDLVIVNPVFDYLRQAELLAEVVSRIK